MTMPPEEQTGRGRDLGKAVTAYMALMDEVATETQYHGGKRENADRIAELSTIIQAARAPHDRPERSGGT